MPTHNVLSADADVHNPMRSLIGLTYSERRYLGSDSQLFTESLQVLELSCRHLG